jgi:protein-S-isoprenylcysteine O-methyltransferase Ste14
MVGRSSSRLDDFKHKLLPLLLTPGVDKAIAVIAVFPFGWLTYIRLHSIGFDIPRIALAIQGLILIGTMITRKTPVRVSTNPWYWLLTFVETYWILVVFAVLQRGRPIAPYLISGSLATLGAMVMIWARISLGRSIGLVPALRSLVTRGAYRYARHPIYSGAGVVFIGSLLNGYTPLNLAAVALGIFWFILKSLAEESFLRFDPAYEEYMRRVRWRWIPGIV